MFRYRYQTKKSIRISPPKCKTKILEYCHRIEEDKDVQISPPNKGNAFGYRHQNAKQKYSDITIE